MRRLRPRPDPALVELQARAVPVAAAPRGLALGAADRRQAPDHGPDAAEAKDRLRATARRRDDRADVRVVHAGHPGRAPRRLPAAVLLDSVQGQGDDPGDGRAQARGATGRRRPGRGGSIMTTVPVWPTAQIAMVRRLAGKLPTAVLARRLARVGPPRTRCALHCWASRNRVSIRPDRSASRLPERRRHEWSDAETALLRSMVGRADPAAIADALNRRFGTERSVNGVCVRARRLGISYARHDGLGMADMVRIFPIHNRGITDLVDGGFLRAERRGTGRPGSDWLFLPADVEACLRAHPYLFDWRRVAAGRWRDFVRAVALKDPYLTVREAAGRIGVRRAMVQKWIRQGRIDGVVIPGASRFAGFRIPLRALTQIEQLADRTFGPRQIGRSA